MINNDCKRIGRARRQAAARKGDREMLKELCEQITCREDHVLPPGHRLGIRLACPEYSKTVQEVKTYPLLNQDRVFALFWHIAEPLTLYASMRPSPEPFSYRCHFTDGKLTQLHTHDYIELAYIVEGEFRQKILGKEIVFQEGDLCLIDKNCLHQDFLDSKPASILFLGIANDMFAEIMEENTTSQKIIAFLQTALLKQKDLQQYLHFRPNAGAAQAVTKEMEESLERLLGELCHRDTGSPYICKGLLLRIFRILSTKYEFSLSKELQKTMNWVLFEEVTDYIKNHSASVCIQDLVDTFHFQEDYFNRLIKKKTGLTYSDYVKQLRLNHAARLLLHSSQTVEEIMEASGYRNKGYFYRIFQEKYGTTPSQYRKKGGDL